ncbi:GAF and ANTAR domain-containing protein [Mycobacterium sp. 236(2023)]|uniref:GAF and ANTAR domain-containing protein n=1 Tax=Mycobacterium sp. 236(2023) TaxID=3038163 RepID=UPI00241508B2|nr:GAF and ANTAR domain-containing protein [Mycobacterium sp. 236(2023)]MDG4664852.1 GAF and ANTAR domain-containing protein [Mycobacterium sp. 236(2023)]
MLEQSNALSDLHGLGVLSDTQFSALHILCRALHVDGPDLGATLDAILTSATAAISGADHAGVNLVVRGRFEPQATLGSAPEPLDALQHRTGMGPCVDASRSQVSVDIDDMASDGRWPDFAAAALSSGVQSMLCVPLWVDERRLGSLSLYAESRAAFDNSAKRLAELYATHAAVALLEAQRADQLRRALQSRDVIGQAKGVLMERHRITADAAFAMLDEVSRTTNRKIADVAEILADTGQLPHTAGAQEA